MGKEIEHPFVSTKQIEIKVRYVKRGDRTVLVRGKRCRGEMLLQTTWKPLSVGDMYECFGEADGPGGVNWQRYCLAVVSRCLMAWDIEGVPCNFENFCNLDPIIGTDLISQYVATTCPQAQESK